jgi:succinoglycan biosynthesis transport protein ExoP
MSADPDTAASLFVLPNGQGADPYDDQTHMVPVLKQYIHTVIRWKWVVIAAIAACLVIGLINTLLTPPTYTASSQIEINREQKKVTNVQGLDSAQGLDNEFYATQYALLKAPSLAQRVVKKLDLAHNSAFFAAAGVSPDTDELSSTKAVPLTGAQLNQLKSRERLAANLLLGHIAIEPVQISRLVKVSFTSRSASMSALIANAWTQEFIGASMDRQFAATADARNFLEGRLASLKIKLGESERQTVTYATSKGITALETGRDAQGKSLGQRTLAAADLEALNTALAQATTERIAAASRVATKRGDVSPEALSNPAISDLRKQRSEAAAEYAKLLIQFEPGYPAAQALAAKIRSLDGAISRETARVTASRGQSYQEALAKENALRAEVQKLRVQFDTQQRDSIQYGIYQREADTNRQLYDALLQRYKELGIAGLVGVNNIAIVDVAEAPTGPSAPSLPKNMALALIIGLGLAAVLVLALEQIKEGIVDPDQVTRGLNLPLLGYTPIAENEPLSELENPKAELSEAYFSIHSNLAFATSHGLPKSFIVTSTKPGEGKSTTALALARIAGRTGKRVLLVDADMRKPSLHHRFEIENQEGLSNLLAGGDNLMALVHAAPFKGGFILLSGPTPPSPAELLSGDRMRSLVEDMLRHFDHVIIDAPPVLGLTDAPLLASNVEGCVFVIQAGESSIRTIRASLRRLLMVNAHIFGAVLTKLSRRDVDYGYGYGYAAYGEDIDDGKPRS